MILGSSTEIQVFVATKPVDFRNYAERKIMQSARADATKGVSLSTA